MKNKQGFSLLEVLLAVFLLEIGLLAVASFYSYSMQVTKYARNQTTAANLAQGILDEELSITYENLPIGTSTKERYSLDASSPFYNWEKQVSVTYIDLNLTEQSFDTNMKKIIVTIFFQESGTEKSIQTASIKARH